MEPWGHPTCDLFLFWRRIDYWNKEVHVLYVSLKQPKYCTRESFSVASVRCSGTNAGLSIIWSVAFSGMDIVSCGSLFCFSSCIYFSYIVFYRKRILSHSYFKRLQFVLRVGEGKHQNYEPYSLIFTICKRLTSYWLKVIQLLCYLQSHN